MNKLNSVFSNEKKKFQYCVQKWGRHKTKRGGSASKNPKMLFLKYYVSTQMIESMWNSKQIFITADVNIKLQTD